MYQKELQLAIQAAKKAEPTFRKYFGTKPKVQSKGGNFRNIVSFVDRAIEKQLKDFLLKNFPAYGFIGEESGEMNRKAEYVWIVDPIDGTTNYIYGSPDCAISIALLKNNSPVVGVTFSPVSKRFFQAAKGSGARLNGKPIKVSKVTETKKTYGGFGWGRDVDFAKKMFPGLVPHVGKLRVLGSSTIALGSVAAGIYDFFVGHEMEIWDYAAGQILVEEAGGKFILPENLKIQIATNKVLVPKLLELLK